MPAAPPIRPTTGAAAIPPASRWAGKSICGAVCAPSATSPAGKP
ncbi:outer membrane efflux protein, partial [Stenotrophomonas maltophilia]